MTQIAARQKRVGLAIPLLLCICAGLALAHEGYTLRPDPLPAAPRLTPPSSRIDLLNEDFEGAWLPMDWATMTSGETFEGEQTSARARSGVYGAYVHCGPQGASQDEWLVSPTLDLSGTVMPTLEFWEDEAYWSGFRTAGVIVDL